MKQNLCPNHWPCGKRSGRKNHGENGSRCAGPLLDRHYILLWNNFYFVPSTILNLFTLFLKYRLHILRIPTTQLKSIESNWLLAIKTIIGVRPHNLHVVSWGAELQMERYFCPLNTPRVGHANGEMDTVHFLTANRQLNSINFNQIIVELNRHN